MIAEFIGTDSMRSRLSIPPVNSLGNRNQALTSEYHIQSGMNIFFT